MKGFTTLANRYPGKRVLMRSGGGHIVNVSSAAGLLCAPEHAGRAHYVAPDTLHPGTLPQR